MNSLYSTIEKIKCLEEEKTSLLLEVEELKKISEAKATALENQANRLQEEIESLRILRINVRTIIDQLNDSEVVDERNALANEVNALQDLHLLKTLKDKVKNIQDQLNNSEVIE